MALDIALFIPARMTSQRLPGKPLIPIRGADGRARPLMEHCWRAGRSMPGIGSVHLLVDGPELAEAGEAFGAEVCLTSHSARNGTERCAEALDLLDRTPDLIINLQGDAFLTPPDHVAAVAARFKAGDVQVATPVFEAPPAHLARLRSDAAAGRVGGTTAVTDSAGRALYFSKAVLPSAARHPGEAEAWPVLHHVGLYGYTPAALRTYADLAPSPLEQAEGLEQLRFLENGIAVHCAMVTAPPHGFWEVNNPEDVAVVEAILAAGSAP